MKTTTSDVLFDEIPGQNGRLGVITLNRPQVLNALNHIIFITVDEQLVRWEHDETIKAIVIRAAEGRAFCAGGDIRYTYERKLAKDPTLPNFFRDEYQMNRRIYHLSKPYIALLDGITMGGGVGISIHGSHRVATEKLMFAMPETGIGFYPDVGTTYHLARLPNYIGIYLGLTGARISAADCFALGLVQDVIAQASLPNIIPALASTALPDKNAVTTVLKQFAITVPPSELLQYQDEIESCFSKNTVEEILQALDAKTNDWCQQTAKILRSKSPTSLKVTLNALQKAKELDFNACMQMELGLTYQFVREHDFFEGIRAAIIDKDQAPHWKPERLSDVTSDIIAKYFKPLIKELS